jgi:hypothetical protein
MGVGGSTISEDRVNEIIDEKIGDFLTPSDLTSYAKSSDLGPYLKSDIAKGLYVDESDRANVSTTSDTDDTKWVTPKYVTNKVQTGNINTSTVATYLGRNTEFRDAFISPLSRNNEFRGGVADALAPNATFVSGMFDQFQTQTPSATTFRTNLARETTNFLKQDPKFLRDTKGEKGDAGTFDNDNVEENLWNKGNHDATKGYGAKVMWCADGELCKVPLSKKGVEFTSRNQTIKGFNDIVNIDGHLELQNGKAINFARDAVKTPQLGGIGQDDAKIIAHLATDANHAAQVEKSALQIYGIGRQKADGTPRKPKIMMFDDVEIAGNNTVFGNIINHGNTTIDGSLTNSVMYAYKDTNFARFGLRNNDPRNPNNRKETVLFMNDSGHKTEANLATLRNDGGDLHLANQNDKASIKLKNNNIELSRNLVLPLDHRIVLPVIEDEDHAIFFNKKPIEWKQGGTGVNWSNVAGHIVQTIIPWGDGSRGGVVQILYGHRNLPNSYMRIRRELNISGNKENKDWSNWTEVLKMGEMGEYLERIV